MRTLEVGDKLKKDIYEIIVVENTGNVIGHKLNSDLPEPICWNTPEDLEQQGWKLVEPEWRPEIDEMFYYVDFMEKDMVDTDIWRASDYDLNRHNHGTIFKTKEEAIARAKQMLDK